MSVLCFWGDRHDDRSACHEFLLNACHPSDVFCATSLEELRRCLSDRTPDLELVFLAPGSVEGLRALVERWPRFCGLRTIVLLPDDSPETFALAQAIHPRYLAPAAGGWEDLQAVLGHMLEKTGVFKEKD